MYILLINGLFELFFCLVLLILVIRKKQKKVIVWLHSDLTSIAKKYLVTN